MLNQEILSHSTCIFAQRIRLHVLDMIYKSQSSHIGSCYSIADILTVLYNGILNIKPHEPNYPDRDRFILSKGHAAAVLYAVLAEAGFFPPSILEKFNQDGSQLSGHVSSHLPGIEVSTGSLGHGLSIGCGMALAAKRNHHDYKVWVLLSDGECDEGSNWEAALFAPHHHLNNLQVIIDYNKIQSLGNVSDILKLEPLVDKWKAFGWQVCEVNGHDLDAMFALFSTLSLEKEKPTIVIAHTIKGKGVSFMENELLWHYKSPNLEQYKQAKFELSKLL